MSEYVRIIVIASIDSIDSRYNSNGISCSVIATVRATFIMKRRIMKHVREVDDKCRWFLSFFFCLGQPFGVSISSG